MTTLVGTSKAIVVGDGAAGRCGGGTSSGCLGIDSFQRGQTQILASFNTMTLAGFWTSQSSGVVAPPATHVTPPWMFGYPWTSAAPPPVVSYGPPSVFTDVISQTDVCNTVPGFNVPGFPPSGPVISFAGEYRTFFVVGAGDATSYWRIAHVTMVYGAVNSESYGWEPNNGFDPNPDITFGPDVSVNPVTPTYPGTWELWADPAIGPDLVDPRAGVWDRGSVVATGTFPQPPDWPFTTAIPPVTVDLTIDVGTPCVAAAFYFHIPPPEPGVGSHQFASIFLQGDFTGTVDVINNSSGSAPGWGDSTAPTPQTWIESSGGIATGYTTPGVGHLMVTSEASAATFVEEDIPLFVGSGNALIFEFRVDALPTGVPDVDLLFVVTDGVSVLGYVGVVRGDGTGAFPAGDSVVIFDGTTAWYAPTVVDPVAYYSIRWAYSSSVLVPSQVRIWPTGTIEPSTWDLSVTPTGTALGTTFGVRLSMPSNASTIVQAVTADILALETDCIL